jgi:MoxR-like ATPase
MNNREKFKEAVVKKYGNSNFTIVEAKAICEGLGFTESQYKTIYTHVMRHVKVDKGIYTFPADHHFGTGQKTVKPSPVVVKAEKKKTLQSDLDIINESVDPVAQKWEKKSKEAKQSFEKPVVKKKAVTKTVSSTVSLIPKSDPQYVTGGHFKDIKTILQSKIFYPVFITGLSGNGKTCMIHEVCAKLKRDLVRVNITIETDEDDLLGGFRLLDGETVWHDGPIINAMRNGSIALIDEIDLASHKIMCLQPVLEGKPIYLKKINEVVYPAEGFNVIATANTKGKGSDDGRFIGTNILNEAFLDRFSATFYQEYPSIKMEAKILNKYFDLYELKEEDFVDKLTKWADVIRRSFKEGAVDEIVTTRRLIDITKSYSIFNDKLKAVAMCLERFDDETKESFTDLYTKIDAGVSLEDLNPSEQVEDEVPEVKVDDAPPF